MTKVIKTKKMIDNGIESLILEGSEAGGHIGPVSINVLAQEKADIIRQIAPELFEYISSILF